MPRRPKPMTLPQLLEIASRLRGWRKMDRVLIRRVPRPGSHLRECPITAVANYLAGKKMFKDPGRCWAAARYIGLPVAKARRIVYAADHQTWRDKKLRQELLTALRIA